MYLGACLRAVHDGVALECRERVVHSRQTLLRIVVATVDYPSKRSIQVSDKIRYFPSLWLVKDFNKSISTFRIKN